MVDKSIWVAEIERLRAELAKAEEQENRAYKVYDAHRVRVNDLHAQIKSTQKAARSAVGDPAAAISKEQMRRELEALYPDLIEEIEEAARDY